MWSRRRDSRIHASATGIGEMCSCSPTPVALAFPGKVSLPIQTVNQGRMDSGPYTSFMDRHACSRPTFKKMHVPTLPYISDLLRLCLLCVRHE